jgi:hypothetical protein
MHRGFVATIMVVALLLMPVAGQELAKRFSNQDVIDMVGLGLGEDVIIEKIRHAQDPAFDTSMDGLKSLKAAQVPDSIIKVMINPKAGMAPPPAAAPAMPAAPAEDPNLPPKEVGVWWKDGANWQLIDGQNVSQAKMGGRWGSFATMGIKAKHWNGFVNGKSSRNVVRENRPVFFFYVLEGTSAADYVLIKLDPKGDKRQFEIGSIGGVVGGKSGVRTDKMRPFSYERVAARTYKITLDEDLPGGEWGFFMGTGQAMALSGGGGPTGGTSQGRMYDFAIPK